MSKAKNPQEKKRLSLDHDRRNTYGECPTSSRKSIAQNKQRRKMAERRAASQILAGLKGAVDEESAADTEFRAKVKSAKIRASGFRKLSDVPLREMIARKLERRKQ